MHRCYNSGMQISIEQLPDDVSALKALLAREITQRQQTEARNRELEELIAFFKARLFSRKREAVIHPGQGTLFNEAELEATDSFDVKSEKETITYTRGKPKRKPLPPHWPREDIIHDLSEADRQCGCGACLTEIGEEVSEQLDIIPARFRVLRHIRKKYACKSCQEKVRIAPLPPQPIAKSYASPGLLAYIATSKYVDGLPLYRIENILSRFDCEIPRSTLASWMIKVSQLLTPLLNLMREELLSGSVLHMDETTVQCLKEKGRLPTTKSYMWVMARGDPGRKIVIFYYDPSRSSQVARDLIDEFQGYLITDGYEGYAIIGRRPSIIHCGCWDHLRRKFHDVIKGRPKEAKPGLADEALYWIGKLYDVERHARNVHAHRRWILRDLYSRGIIHHLERWKNSLIDTVTPKSLLGKALHYMHSQWPKLTPFLKDGQIPFSNQLAENAIRPFVVGRKAWLFSDTPAGAHASAAIYSVIETAKANGIEPYQYLRTVFELLPQATTADDVAALLPWHLSLN